MITPVTNGWERKKLGELFRIKHGYAFKGEYFSASGPYIVLTPGNFHEEGGFDPRSGKEKFYSGTIPSGYILSKDDLIVAMTEQAEGLLGSAAIVPASNLYLHNQRLGLITEISGEELDRRFLYYLFNTQCIRQQIRATANGAKVRHTSPSRIYDVTVNLPPILTQRKIAAVLSAYDDLIENNTRRIQILEEMAQALYREWFVHFRFPGHEKSRMVESEMGTIPEGWKVVPFGQLLQSTLGGDWGKDETDEKENSPVTVVRGTDFDDLTTGGLIRAPRRFIAASSLVKRKLLPGDVVIENSVNAQSRCTGRSLLITRGLLNNFQDDVICASFCKNYRLHDPGLAPLMHLQLKHLYSEGRMKFYQNIAANGIGNFQSQRFLESEVLVLPEDDELCKQMCNILCDLTATVHAETIYNLRQTRDLLLPKLISGEVDVTELDIVENGN